MDNTQTTTITPLAIWEQALVFWSQLAIIVVGYLMLYSHSGNHLPHDMGGFFITLAAIGCFGFTELYEQKRESEARDVAAIAAFITMFVIVYLAAAVLGLLAALHYLMYG